MPFLGPVFHYGFTPDQGWVWTSGRFWLQVLPAAVTVVAGLIMMVTANRAVGVFAAYLAAAAGAWFIVGPIFGPWINSSGMYPGAPLGGVSRRVFEQIGLFAGLGAVILFFAAQALGRFNTHSVRDVRASERHDLADTAAPAHEPHATGAYPAEPGAPTAEQARTSPGARRA